MKYHCLTQQEKYQIYALLKEGFSLSAIAKNIGKDKSTILVENYNVIQGKKVIVLIKLTL